MHQTLNQMLDERASMFPNKECVISNEDIQGFTYLELHQMAYSLGASLSLFGCKKGDRVILGFNNTPLFFAILFACFNRGLVAVPVDAQLSEDELTTIIDHSDPAAVICSPTAIERLSKICDIDRLLAADDNSNLFTLTKNDTQALDLVALQKEVNPSDNLANDFVDISEETPALLLYTSGTTGTPKGVLYTHNALTTKIRAIGSWFKFDNSFRSLCLLPTHFGHGLICNCLSVFGYGGTLLILPPINLDLIKQLWSIVEKYDINYFSCVPTVLRLLKLYAQDNEGEDSPHRSLKFITCASAPLSPEEIRSFEDTFHVPVLNCYGLTETAGWSACSPNKSYRNLNSVGRALNCTIRIVDDTGKVLSSGKKGEIQIKGPSVLPHYYAPESASNSITESFEDKAITAQPKAIQGGWFSTGDIGELDQDGSLILHARIKELIIRAGKNIYPAEIDSMLMTHPDIEEACSFGITDTLLGEKVAACIVRKQHTALSESDIIEYTQTKIADYKCPQKIHFVKKIPKNNRGKVSRLNLQTMFQNN